MSIYAVRVPVPEAQKIKITIPGYLVRVWRALGLELSLSGAEDELTSSTTNSAIVEALILGAAVACAQSKKAAEILSEYHREWDILVPAGSEAENISKMPRKSVQAHAKKDIGKKGGRKEMWHMRRAELLRRELKLKHEPTHNLLPNRNDIYTLTGGHPIATVTSCDQVDTATTRTAPQRAHRNIGTGAERLTEMSQAEREAHIDNFDRANPDSKSSKLITAFNKETPYLPSKSLQSVDQGFVAELVSLIQHHAASGCKGLLKYTGQNTKGVLLRCTAHEKCTCHKSFGRRQGRVIWFHQKYVITCTNGKKKIVSGGLLRFYLHNLSYGVLESKTRKMANDLEFKIGRARSSQVAAWCWKWIEVVGKERLSASTKAAGKDVAWTVDGCHASTRNSRSATVTGLLHPVEITKVDVTGKDTTMTTETIEYNAKPGTTSGTGQVGYLRVLKAGVHNVQALEKVGVEEMITEAMGIDRKPRLVSHDACNAVGKVLQKFEILEQRDPWHKLKNWRKAWIALREMSKVRMKRFVLGPEHLTIAQMDLVFDGMQAAGLLDEIAIAHWHSLWTQHKNKGRKPSNRQNMVYGFNKLLRIAASKDCTVVVKADPNCEQGDVVMAEPNATSNNQGPANSNDDDDDDETKACNADEEEDDEGGLETIDISNAECDAAAADNLSAGKADRVIVEIGKLDECMKSAKHKFEPGTYEAIVEDMTVPLSKLDGVTLSSDNVGKSEDLVREYFMTADRIAYFRQWDEEDSRGVENKHEKVRAEIQTVVDAAETRGQRIIFARRGMAPAYILGDELNLLVLFEDNEWKDMSGRIRSKKHANWIRTLTWFHVTASAGRRQKEPVYPHLKFTRWPDKDDPKKKRDFMGRFNSHFSRHVAAGHDKNGKTLYQAILNFAPHMSGRHGEYCRPPFGTCCEANEEKLPRGRQCNPDYCEEVRVVFDEMMKGRWSEREARYYTMGVYTAQVESFNKFVLFYRPKLVHFHRCELARVMCAAMDWNANKNHVLRSCIGGPEGDTLEAVVKYRKSWREEVLEHMLAFPVASNVNTKSSLL